LHAQCYAEAMYPWEISRTKSPLVSLNNLGILRTLPPPVKRLALRPPRAEPPHSGGAAEAAPTNGHPGNQVLKTWIWPTIPVHLPPTQAEWIVQR
jgi:hypothetical protein